MTKIAEQPVGSKTQLTSFLDQYAPKEEPPVAEVKKEEPVVEEKSPLEPQAKAEAKPEVKAEEKKEKPSKKEAKAEKKEEPKVEVKAEGGDGEEELTQEQKDLIELYEGKGEEKKTEVKSEEKPKIEEKKVEKPKPSEKELEYESLTKDPFVNAVIEWRKAGGKNPKDFIEKAGLVMPTKTIEDYVREEAVALGFDGDDMLDAVEQAIENFENLSKIDQKKKLLEYQNKDQGALDERLKSFIIEQGSAQALTEKVNNEANEKLQKVTAELKGQKFAGALIDEPMVQKIEQFTPMFSPPIYDENGNLTGYDLDFGLDVAKNYVMGAKARQEAYMLGLTKGQQQFAKERHRANADPIGGGAQVAKGADEELDTAIVAFTNKFGRKP